MNKKGEVGFSIVTFIVFFLIGMAVVNLLKPEVTDARSSDNMDCANSSISDGNKLTCLAIDLTIPYFFVLILSIGLAILTEKLLGGSQT